MTFKVLPRTRETTATTGTGAILTSGAASPDNVTFASGMSVGDTAHVCVVSGDGIGWQEFLATYSSANTLQRTKKFTNHLGTTADITLVGTSRVFAVVPHDVLDLLNRLGQNSWKRYVDVATAAALPTNTYANGTSGDGATLTATANGILTVDTLAVEVGWRVLVKDEATLARNGIYVVTQRGSAGTPYILTRVGDHNSPQNMYEGDVVIVGHGSGTPTNADTLWAMNIDAAPVVVGTTHFSFVAVHGASTLFSALGDVSISSAANNDFAQYQTSDSKWHNRTAAQAAASLPALIGDSGSGGTKGLAPAPGAGDAAAGAFLAADATYKVPYQTGWHYPASFATVAALPANTYANGTLGVGATLTGNSNGALAAIDGVTPVVGYRLLVKNEATASRNGIYVVTQVGDGSHPYILTRAADFNSTNNINQADVVVVGPNSTVNASKFFQMTASASPIVLGTTGFSWSRVTVGDKYIIGASVSGLLTASQLLLSHRFATDITIPANFGDHLGYGSMFCGTAAPTASTVVNVDKAGVATPNVFSNIGTITFAAGVDPATPTAATSGGTAKTFAKGDVIRLVGPSSADATFAGFYATIVGFET